MIVCKIFNLSEAWNIYADVRIKIIAVTNYSIVCLSFVTVNAFLSALRGQPFSVY